jgi:hypothetical protein
LAWASWIASHSRPSTSQRNQRYWYEVGEFVHVPSVAVSCSPTSGSPEIVGRCVFCAAVLSATAAV